MSELGYLKHVVLEELSKLDKNDANYFLEWIKSGKIEKDLSNFIDKKKPFTKLKKISKDLKALLPKETILNFDEMKSAVVGPNSDCDAKHTIHVDEFIYNDDDVDKMHSKNIIPKYYCVNCKSNDIKETILISHSSDAVKLAYVFTVLLPEDLQKYRLLDAGSRIGAVLYGAFYWTNCQEIIGVEIDSNLTKIQQNIVEKYGMRDRVKVIDSDILNQATELDSCDIIFLHNVFEFFMPAEEQVKAWAFLRKHLKSGCYVISIPAVEESLLSLSVYEDYATWLQIAGPFQKENEQNFDMSDTQFGEIHFYKVL